MEFIFIGGGMLVLALVVYELIEGIYASGVWNGDDEEIFAPLALFSLLAFIAGLSYFG